jgi:hypothetical protein
MAEGIVHVFVNGSLAWTQKAATPVRSGRFLRRTTDKNPPSGFGTDTPLGVSLSRAD